MKCLNRYSQSIFSIFSIHDVPLFTTNAIGRTDALELISEDLNHLNNLNMWVTELSPVQNMKHRIYNLYPRLNNFDNYI